MLARPSPAASCATSVATIRMETSRAQHSNAASQADIILVLRRLALAEASDLAVRLRPDEVKLVDRGLRAPLACSGPLLAEACAFEAALRSPPSVEKADLAERVDIEDLVAAFGFDRFFDVPEGC
jgi:hypothetical protein